MPMKKPAKKKSASVKTSVKKSAAPAKKKAAAKKPAPAKKKAAAKKPAPVKKAAPAKKIAASASKPKPSSKKAASTRQKDLVRVNVHCFNCGSGAHNANLKGVRVSIYVSGQSTPVDSSLTGVSGKTYLTAPRFGTYRIVGKLGGFSTVTIETPILHPTMNLEMPMKPETPPASRRDVDEKTLISITYYVHLNTSMSTPIEGATCTLQRTGNLQTAPSLADGTRVMSDQCNHTFLLKAEKTGYVSYSYNTYLDRHDDGWDPFFPLCPI